MYTLNHALIVVSVSLSVVGLAGNLAGQESAGVPAATLEGDVLEVRASLPEKPPVRSMTAKPPKDVATGIVQHQVELELGLAPKQILVDFVEQLEKVKPHIFFTMVKLQRKGARSHSADPWRIKIGLIAYSGKDDGQTATGSRSVSGSTRLGAYVSPTRMFQEIAKAADAAQLRGPASFSSFDLDPRLTSSAKSVVRFEVNDLDDYQRIQAAFSRASQYFNATGHAKALKDGTYEVMLELRFKDSLLDAQEKEK